MKIIRILDYRHRKGKPEVFAFVDAPHIHQGYNNCGAALSKNVLSRSAIVLDKQL